MPNFQSGRKVQNLIRFRPENVVHVVKSRSGVQNVTKSDSSRQLHVFLWILHQNDCLGKIAKVSAERFLADSGAAELEVYTRERRKLHTSEHGFLRGAPLQFQRLPR